MDPTDKGQIQARDRIYLELANRTTLLALHGWVGILVGLAMAATGAPLPIEEAMGPWARLALGGWGLGFGAILLVGASIGRNRTAGWSALIAGTLGLAFWHALVMMAYADGAFDGGIKFLMPGETLGPDVTNRGYIPFIYLGYVMLVLTHAVTLILLDRPRR